MFGLSTAETLATLFLSAVGFAFSGQLTMMAATVFEKARLGAGLFVLGALTAFGFAAFAIYSIANLIEKAAG